MCPADSSVFDVRGSCDRAEEHHYHGKGSGDRNHHCV